MKKTRYVLLGLLQEESLSGYEIKKAIDIRMSFFWKESFGQIYPELAKLAEEGMVEAVSKDEEGEERSGREKIRYKITGLGRIEFMNWIAQENEKDTVRSEFLLKMYLSTMENIEEMKIHIKAFKEQWEERLVLFRMFESELSPIADIHNHRQILNVLKLGIRQAELYIEWCNEVAASL